MAEIPQLAMQIILNELGFAISKTVIDRTRSGLDYNGVAFVPYSKGYARKRSRAGKQINKVDLTYTTAVAGRMVSQHNIVHEINGSYDTVDVFMRDPLKEQIAIYHQFLGAGPAGKNKPGHVIRKFFGLSDPEVEKIIQLAYDKADLIADATKDVIMNTLKELEEKISKLGKSYDEFRAPN